MSEKVCLSRYVLGGTWYLLINSLFSYGTTTTHLHVLYFAKRGTYNYKKIYESFFCFSFSLSLSLSIYLSHTHNLSRLLSLSFVISLSFVLILRLFSSLRTISVNCPSVSNKTVVVNVDFDSKGEK